MVVAIPSFWNGLSVCSLHPHSLNSWGGAKARLWLFSSSQLKPSWEILSNPQVQLKCYLYQASNSSTSQRSRRLFLSLYNILYFIYGCLYNFALFWNQVIVLFSLEYKLCKGKTMAFSLLSCKTPDNSFLTVPSRY